MEFLQPLLTSEGLVSLLTLSIMEIVLGIDNIIFISIITSRLPQMQQQKARILGLSLALLFRVALLFAVTWIMGLTKPIFTVFTEEISGRDLILISGGLFLLFKSTREIHHNTEGGEEQQKKVKAQTFSSAIFQIILLDIVFSFDSILTAVGLVKHIVIMIAAVIISMVVMILSARTIGDFINRHPTVKMLALSFLLMIGLLLIVEAFDVHVPRGYVYFAMAFSLFVEFLNIRVRAKQNVV